jgi:cell division ATPase FtsA
LALKSLIDRLGAVKDETLAILEIGANITEIIIFKSNTPVFNRKIPVTGMDFTNSLKTTLASERGVLQIDLKEAEEIKRACGIPKVGSPELIREKISSAQVLSLIRPALERLSSQISQSFDYYRESRSPDKINRLIIYGGGAKLKGLDEFLASELNIKVELGDCVAGVDKLEGALKKEDLPQLDLAIGAALNKAKGINLLPAELKTQMQKSVWQAASKAIITASVLILAFVYIGMQIQLSNFNKKLAAQDLLSKALGPQVKESKEQLEINNIINKQPFWEDVFKELTNLSPDNLYLTAMTVDSDNLILQGRILSKEVRPEEILSQFMLNLENGIFKEVSLVSTKKRDPFESLEFEVKYKLE